MTIEMIFDRSPRNSESYVVELGFKLCGSLDLQSDILPNVLWSPAEVIRKLFI